MRRGLVLAAVLLFAVPASAARLPILASHDWWPVFSPDSRSVAFTEVNGQGRIFALKVVDARTKRVRTLAQSSSQLLPSWSPDSKTIAYQSGGWIWTVGADGAGKRRVHPGLYPALGTKLAYVTGGVVYVDGANVSGPGVIGMPAWSPGGGALAYTRSDGIYVLAAGADSKVTAPGGEVRAVAFSPDGTKLAYVSQGTVYVVAPDAGAAPQRVAGPFADIGPLAWSPASDQLAYTVRGGVELSTNEPTWHSQLLVKGAAVGTSYAPTDPHGDVLAYSGPRPSCPAHDAIRIYGEPAAFTGTCVIAGTAGADVILGSGREGDVVLAGAGNDVVRVADGHTDRVNCGPGRDTVWADRHDELTGCEIVHR
jgi:WD40 repeat protein